MARSNPAFLLRPGVRSVALIGVKEIRVTCGKLSEKRRSRGARNGGSHAAPELQLTPSPARSRSRAYSLVLLFRFACISFFSSSGVSFGRSMVSVILLILPVNANGTW